MPNKKGEKKYEPPTVKEISGTFEQAMGVSQCSAGGAFTAGDCKGGQTAQTGCAFGLTDQACRAGAGDGGGCTVGWTV